MFMCNFGNGDPTRPSFFEMMAQQQMMPTFKPALNYVFSVSNSCRYYALSEITEQCVGFSTEKPKMGVVCEAE